MKRKRRLFGILLIVTALIIMQLPVSEADAATSASDFKMEGTTLVKYRGKDKKVTIPKTVEVIGEGAFEGKDSVETVVLSKSVKVIEPYAFWDCENLETVSLGTGLTEIGDFAFANCKGLVKMTIPENIRSIGVQAFMDCVNLEEITIPPEVTEIHESAFDGCSKLTIHCEKGSAADKYAEEFYERQKEMPEYEDVDDYESDSDVAPTPTPTPTPEANPGTVLGDTKVVGNHAVIFVDNTSLEVKDGTVLDFAAMPEESLIEESEEGTGLAKYTIVDGRIVADQAYYKNSKVKEYILSEGIEEIGQFSFARSSVEKIQMQDGVKKIGYGAFYHCDNLSEVELPGTVEVVEPNAFTYTAWVDDFLKDGTEDFLISGGVLVAYRGQESKVSIPEDVRVIAAEAFANHTEIKELVLSDNLITIGEGAFENCSNLSTVVMGKQVKQIKDRAFAGCKISNVSLPKTVEELGIGAFEKEVQITYAGEIPAMTHELTAERLSNEAYRKLSGEQEESGVKVNGLPGVTASLEGAARSYILSVVEADDIEDMETAYRRVYEEDLPEECLVYDLKLTDNSGIPITKLGKQTLQVNMPLSDTYASQNLMVYSLDRNGQLELLSADRVRIDGAQYLRFNLEFLSQIAIVKTADSYNGVIVLEESTTIESMSQAPGQEAEVSIKYHWILAAVVMTVGLLCLLWRKKEYR